MKGFPLEFGIGVRGPKCLNDGATRMVQKVLKDRFTGFDTIPAVTDSQPPSQTRQCCQWSNYSIIYEGTLKYGERGPSRSHMSGDQNVFLLQFQYKKVEKKTFANCNKASINDG